MPGNPHQSSVFAPCPSLPRHVLRTTKSTTDHPERRWCAYRLQNQTRTTSFSMQRERPSMEISSEVGFGLCRKARSRATRTPVSMEVRFFRRRPIESAVLWGGVTCEGLRSKVETVVRSRDGGGGTDERVYNFTWVVAFVDEKLGVIWLRSLCNGVQCVKKSDRLSGMKLHFVAK